MPFEAIFATSFVVIWPSDAYTLPEPSMASESGVMKFVDANNSAVAALDVHRGRHHVQPRDRIQIADIAALERRGVHRDDLLVGRMRRREAIGVRLAGEPIGERGRFGHG